MDRVRAGLEGFLKEAEHQAASAERWGGQRRLLVRDHSARPGGASLQGLGAEGTLTEVYTGPRASSLGADVRLGEGSGPHDCSRRRRPARWRALCGAACGGAPEGVSSLLPPCRPPPPRPGPPSHQGLATKSENNASRATAFLALCFLFNFPTNTLLSSETVKVN